MAIGVAVALGGASSELARMVHSLKAFGVDEIAVADATGDPQTRRLFDPVQERISAYFFEPDGGQSDGLNKAFAALQSPIVGWLNDDDFLVADGAPIIESAIKDCDVVFGETLFFDVFGAALGYHPHVVADPDALLRGGTISQPSCFFRRQLFSDLGGLNRDLHYVMDWDLWLRMRAVCAKFAHLPELISAVTLDRAAKTAHVRLNRIRELYETHRRHRRPALSSGVLAARSMAGGLVWKLTNAPTPPFAYFAAWERRGGRQRAPGLVNEAGPLLLHVGRDPVTSMRLHWRDATPVVDVDLPAAQPPFALFRVPLGRPLAQLRMAKPFVK